MAKRKGKSKHRKNWLSHFDAGDDTREEFSSRGRLTQPEVKIPDQRQPDAPGLDGSPRCEGMVVGMYPKGAIVDCGGQELLCGIAKTFRPPEGAQDATALAVGDQVTVAMTRPEHADQVEDKHRSDGLILSRSPRSSALSRPEPRSGKRRDEFGGDVYEKVVAANMDVLLVVAATVQPQLHHGLIDRFLIIAQRGQLEPILVINKIDLAEPDPKVIEGFRDLVDVIVPASAATGEGIEQLGNLLAGRRSVFAGQSGVGKSTLINALIPGASAQTRTVRAKDHRGRHTTAATKIYTLSGGGMLLDTPGVRELGINIEPRELSWFFPEFEPFARECRFRDCTHTHEPDCAVKAAADAGRIAPRRYRSYLRILDTLDAM